MSEDADRRPPDGRAPGWRRARPPLHDGTPRAAGVAGDTPQLLYSAADLARAPVAFEGRPDATSGVAKGAWAFRRAASAPPAPPPLGGPPAADVAKGGQLAAADVAPAAGSAPEESGRPRYQIGQSNIGYKLLKKAGWTEEKGLGAAEQGRLKPLEPQLKQDKRGIGADVLTRAGGDSADVAAPSGRQPKKAPPPRDGNAAEEGGAEPLSKRQRKALREAELAREQALARELYREFYPNNV